MRPNGNFKFAVCRFGDPTRARAIRTAPGSQCFLFDRISRRLVSWGFNLPAVLRARRYRLQGDARCRNKRVQTTSSTYANGLSVNRLRRIAATALQHRANASTFCAPSPKLLIRPLRRDQGGQRGCCHDQERVSRRHRINLKIMAGGAMTPAHGSPAR